MYCYAVDIADELKQCDISSSESSLAPDSAPSGSIIEAMQSAMAVTDEPSDSDDSVAMESVDDFEDFCIIDEPGLGIMVSDLCIYYTES